MADIVGRTEIEIRCNPFNVRSIMIEQNNIPFRTKPVKLAYMWRDIDRRAAMYPDAFYVLASLANPDASPESALRSWRIHGGQAFEVPLSVT